MAAPLAPVEVIERSRRGDAVDAPSVDAFVRSWLDGTADDSLMAAWCMAACLRDMPHEHVETLALALVASGDRLELGSLGPTGDVQSTGGVGDATALVAWPLAAALGVRVATVAPPTMGTAPGAADALRAIPRMEAELSLARFVRQAKEAGIAVTAPTSRLAPGDRRLAELRDATGTVPAAGMVAASTIGRAIAAGSRAIALIVPAGPGGLIAGEDAARDAAELMAALAEPWGRRVRWAVVGAGQPLGRGVGNALEVRAAGEVLRGDGAADLHDLAVWCAAALAEDAGVVAEGDGAARAGEALRSGAALRTAERWVEAQGGDPDVWTDPGALPMAPVREDVTAPVAGWVEAVDARAVGEAARWLGAGRLHADQSIDPVAGVEVLVRVGDEVADGQPLAVAHARDEWVARRGREMVADAVRVGAEPAATPPLVLAEGRGGAGAP